jgi:ABC-type multidrug transport system fused ATPase/permease subunit
MVLVYRKSLKLSYVKGGVGDIVNLISIECNRIAEACVHLHYLWSAAFECIVLLIWSCLDIGLAGLVPFAVVFFVLFPLQFLFAIKASAAACRMTEQITKRVHLMAEILTAIKLLKFYTWENYYRKKITEMRGLEMKEMRIELAFKIASFAVVFTTPAISICLAIYTYNALGNELTSRAIFGFLFLLNSLRYPLYFLPNSERNINGAQTSVHRLQDFLMLPEIDTEPENSTLMGDDVFMEIKDADFIWDGDLDHPHVTNLSLTLRKKEVIAIVGDIGSGKSLLAAIMGQLKRVKGEVVTNGCTFGFVPQEPWFINASVRDNIVFGLELNEGRYSDAIRISGLTRDLMMLSNKDDSFVSELNLSPNQKQRLALARVIYQNPDIILMEDCLSDFNQEQSRQIFKECLRNQLSKTKCILMQTQQKQFLSSCDSIIVMKGGKVVEHGTYKELKEKNVNFSAWVTDVVHIEDDPNGLIENMSEIRLDPATSTTRPQVANPLRPTSGNFAHLAMRRRSVQPRSSPLASSDPINAPENNTIRQLMELNSSSMQNSQLNEHTISKMIERSQNSVLTGNQMRPPANFANQDVVARTIDTNNLTVHSLHDFDVGTLEPGDQTDENPYIQFLKTQPGLVAGVFFLGIFVTAHGFRFVCDVWLTFLVDQKEPGDFERNMIILTCLSGVIAISILLRGYGYLQIIIRKGSSWHNKILNAVLRAPMSFYDITPLGHILSFFAKHLFSIDEVLPDTALQVLSFLPLVIGTITLACVYIPWLWTTLPLYFFFWWIAIRVCHDSQDVFQQLECNSS